MATPELAECREVSYPEKCRSVQARKKHKEKTLRDNPDLLWEKNQEQPHLLHHADYVMEISHLVEEERDEPHANCTGSEEEDPVKLSPSPSDHRLRDSLALLELDFTEFREHAQLKLSDTHNTNMYIQELKDEHRQLKKDTNSSITELTRALRELKEENQT
ncbi:hypothetical protein DPX16_19029 [Anabarilius grahami]|uniref:Uncharacterized protein n=1 Tax=Anabarilius grahami TaxID=495550 RepID=A0A3N0YVL1_ANAGA|nr:hypothetical protein DPX16_19029 [Anabarilius grahami]